MNTCYIIGAGDFFGNISPEESDLVIAADGGYDMLASHGVRCDVLIGDMDSISDMPGNIELIRFPVIKDDTDTFLAYKEGVKRGYTKFKILGGTGGREDHTLANYSLLLYAKNRGHDAFLYGNGSVSFVIKNETVVLKGTEGSHLSVFAAGNTASDVSIKGAKYEVNGINLTPEFPLGVSNSFLCSPAEISVGKGALLIIADSSANPLC